MEICVVHLAWAEAPESALQAFLESYMQRDSGVRHRLLVVWNGFKEPDRLAALKRVAAAVDHDDLELGARELDLTAYRLTAESCPEDAVCFINSYSTILHDGWLAALASNLAPPDVGLVGATGSYESPLSGARLPLRLLRTGRYPPFPNPHIRTNAFMLSRELMLSLSWPRITTKRSAWELESGLNGLTRQVQGRGLQALVVGRDGHGYPSDRWRESGTFRVEGQPNLLIADNRTRQYDEANTRLRRKLERLAWGSSDHSSGS